jgi:Protein of unknown function (DUF2934)
VAAGEASTPRELRSGAFFVHERRWLMASTSDQGKGKDTPARSLRAAARKPATRKPKAKAASYEKIAERAYFISESGEGGSDFDNWLRAERELAA